MSEVSGGGSNTEEQSRQLFLDCDGVLADFDSHAETIFGLPPRQAEAEIGSERFWAELRSRHDFYRKLPLMPDAQRLFNAVKHLKPIILTGCPRGGWAEPQKLAWAAEHFPGTRMITCMSIDKRLHMKPGDVLVDDYLKYRQRWVEAGGIFIHYSNADRALAEIGRHFPLKADSKHQLHDLPSLPFPLVGRDKGRIVD